MTTIINGSSPSITFSDSTTQTTAVSLLNAALTRTPTAPTASNGTNTTQIATTAFAYGVFSGGTAGASGFPILVGEIYTIPVKTS